MDKQVKSLIAAACSLPFGIALLLWLERLGLFPWFEYRLWSDVRFVLVLVAGVTYFVTLGLLGRRP